jgi:alpha-glucosidase
MNQLGLFVCFYSPLQMACDLPENYMKHPDAFRFVEAVPCDWERSLLVDGRIGDFCIFARQGRGSDKWYIGGITDEERREAVVPLTFLDPDTEYTLTLWRDGDDADWKTNPYSYLIETRAVHACDTLHVNMASGGGFAAIVSKQ